MRCALLGQSLFWCAVELIDTHCHLDLAPLCEEVEAVLERARAAGLTACLVMGTTLESSRDCVELARRHTMLRAGVGVHPHDAKDVTEETLAALAVLAEDPHVSVIGEVGLDYYRHHSPPAVQERVLRWCVALARAHRLPLSLHCRDAYDALLALLDDMGPATVSGVLHCASGSPAFIERMLAHGFHISFAGNVTYPNAAPLRELVRLVPDDRLLIETDAPFLAPQPVRGDTNEPAHLVHTLQTLARVRAVDAGTIAAVTTANARQLFQLGLPS